MATGFARGAKERGKRIAFGDGQQIIWDHHSSLVFKYNQNIAPQNAQGDADIEWVPFYRGHRIYATQRAKCWRWNMDFRAPVGEFFFSGDEARYADQTMPEAAVIIEPNVPPFKTVAPNKTWPVDRYERVARALLKSGRKVVQLVHGGSSRRLAAARQISAPTFRHAAAMVRRASCVVCPEGGLHHAAAAVGTRAVVLFGGFIPPQVTGYESHVNLTGGAEACGSLHRCEHCIEAMDRISADEVFAHTQGVLNGTE